MIGSSKNNRENYPRKCFRTQEKETWIKFNSGLSTNRPSNNWALNFTMWLPKFSWILPFKNYFFFLRSNVSETEDEVRIKERKGDDEVIPKKIKILKMTWELSTTKVNLFYIIVLANYSTSYFFYFWQQILVFFKTKNRFWETFCEFKFQIHTLTYLKN